MESVARSRQTLPARTKRARREKRRERIDIRVTKELKELFTVAAQLSGTNLTSFVIEAVSERASRVTQAHERLVLSNQDRDQFLAALANPPEPNRALRRAAHKYLGR